jgi:hypothetical protein
MSLSSRSRLVAAPQVQARRFHDEVVVGDMMGGEYYALDEVGAKVWEGLLAGATVAEVATKLAEEYDAEQARIEGDILALVAELLARRLLVEAST